MKNYLTISNLSIFLITITVISILLNCKTPEDQIPYEYVDITINLNKPDYNDLNVIGSHIMIVGGFRGIIIYHSGKDEYKAFERACTFDPYCDRLHYDEIEGNLLDTCCGSRYSLILEGAVLNGPAELPLRQYQTYYNSNTNILRITN